MATSPIVNSTPSGPVILTRDQVDVVADALADRLGWDPERVMANYQTGTIDIQVVDLAVLLGIEV